MKFRKLQFVKINDKAINPWEVSTVTDAGDLTIISMNNGDMITIPKHQGEVKVRDLESIVDCLERATKEQVDE